MRSMTALRCDIRIAALARHQQVKIAHGFAASAQRSRRRNLLHARQTGQKVRHLGGNLVGGVEQKSSGELPVILNRLQYLLF